MADSVYGYKSGPRVPVQVKIDASTTAISVNDMLTLGTAGYMQKVAAGDNALCVAMQACAVPSADGDITILADFSQASVYEFPPASGSTVQGDAGKAFDVGGAQSVDRAASVDGEGGDGSLRCVAVDTVRNTMFVTIHPLISGV